MKAIETLKEITKSFKGYGIEPAWKEAEILVRHGAGIDTVEVYRDNPEFRQEQMAIIEKMVSRRVKREPLSYILGYGEFLGLRLTLGQGVLIPRPETELMAEQAINIVRAQTTDNGQRTMILDLCTGSGCLALALAKEFPEAQVYGIDISKAAVGYAGRNAEINGIENVTFLTGYLFRPLNPEASGQLFDLIISNPPYIKTDDIKSLQPEIRDWEPLIAVDGGPDGLDFYREIIPAAQHFLKDNGVLMLELGADSTNENNPGRQGGFSEQVTDMIEYEGYSQAEVIKDYAGIERIIQARWKN